MRQVRWKFLAAVATALAFGPGPFGVALAHEGHDHGAPHGGTVAETKAHQFEVVFAKDGVKVYPLAAGNKPVDASSLSGTATFYHPSTPDKPWFERPLRAAAVSPGQIPTSLDLNIDLSKAPPKGVTVSFRVAGFADAAEPTATFAVPFTLASPGELVIAKATQADQPAIDALKVCPVSHEELGSMGPPLKVSRGGKSTFLCCKGCLKEVRADPDKFLGASAAAPAPDAKHDHHDH